MKTEVLRILKMVEEGKIDSEAASKLIDSLDDKVEENNEIVKENIVNKEYSEKEFNKFISESNNVSGGKMLYIFVHSKCGDKVRVKLPIGFIKLILGATSGKSIPGVDSNLNIDMNIIRDAINNGLEGRIIDIQSEDGDTVIIEIR